MQPLWQQVLQWSVVCALLASHAPFLCQCSDGDAPPPAPSTAGIPANHSASTELLKYCSQFQDLYAGIAHDLRHWVNSGIGPELLQESIDVWTTKGRKQGIALGFWKGRAYVIDPPNLSGVGHHANIFFTYMHVMADLEKQFGNSIPDVEFVVASSDRPMQLLPPEATSSLRDSAHGGNSRNTDGGSSSSSSTDSFSGTESAHAGTGRRRLQQEATPTPGFIELVSAQSRNGGIVNSTAGTSRGGSNTAGLSCNSSCLHRSMGSDSHTTDMDARTSSMSRGSNMQATAKNDQHNAGHSSRQMQSVVKDPYEAALIHPPLMRFCGSPHHAEIQIPIFHFSTKKYNRRLENILNSTLTYPWSSKLPIAFGRFSNYNRYVHPNATALLRVGSNHSKICKLETPSTLTCKVRQHAIEWSIPLRPGIDLRSGPMLSMSKHAGFKYLLHLDGQALSSRFEQLMPLDSLIFKEESGYTTFYYHLIRPGTHYLSFWRKVPEDLLTGLAWAERNDAAAQEIARNARDFSLRYLNKRTRSCYWFTLLSRYAQLLTYQPAGPASRTFFKPVKEYLASEGRAHEGGKWLRYRTEQDLPEGTELPSEADCKRRTGAEDWAEGQALQSSELQ